MISRKVAEQLVAKLREGTNLFVDVIDQKGVIQASLNHKCVGSFHKIAYDLIKGNRDFVNVEKSLDTLGIPQGVIFVVKENGARVGAVGVSGPPNSIHSVAEVVKLTLETMLAYESQYESFQKYNNSRDIFCQALMYGEHISKEVLISRAEKLGIQADCLRISIFIVTEPKSDFTQLVQRSASNPLASEQDIVAISRSNRIAVFKHLERDKGLLANYRYMVEEYLKWWRRELMDMGVRVQFNIGTIQDKLIRYREAYQHAVWLVTSAKCREELNWFYDFTDQYLRSLVPNEVHRSVFQTYTELIDANTLEYFPDLIGTLESCNYNFIQASQKLFIHKNTTAFRLDKIKTSLNINPVKNPKDRDFVNNLLYYLQQCQ